MPHFFWVVVAGYKKHSCGPMGRLELGLQHAVEPILCGLVQVVAGFVQEQERRVGAYGDRQEQALALPAR
jgi:hypothetical protein